LVIIGPVTRLLPLLLITAAMSQGSVLDFVAASVNDIAITESEVRKAMAVSALLPEGGETGEAYRQRILEALIDERLQYEDAVRFGTAPPDAADVEEAMRKIRARLSAEGKNPDKEFAAAGMTVDEVRASVERQLIIQRYLLDRIRPIAAADDRTREEYDTYYAPEQRARNVAVLPFDEVVEEMRKRSQQRAFDEEIEKWAKDLREKARVVVYKVPVAVTPGRTPIAIGKAPTPAK
jgi:parvulin-like peptidyl-prolyl isomerase